MDYLIFPEERAGKCDFCPKLWDDCPAALNNVLQTQ